MLRSADAFAQDAAWRVSPQALDSLGKQKDADELALVLKTHDLFPGLHDWEQSLLVAVYWQKEALAKMMRTSGQEVLPSMRTKVEQLIRQMEQFHMRMVASARSLRLLDQLSTLEQEIQEAEYFSITWEDGE